MVIRVVIKNLFSFKDETEFNMLSGSIRIHNHHKYNVTGVDVLKMASIYGANGAGKSNLVKVISLLKLIAVSEKIPSNLETLKFRLCEECEKHPSFICMEFVVKGKSYLYSILFDGNKILEEELYRTSPSENKDFLIFSRKIISGIYKVEMSSEFLKSDENKLFVKILEDKMIQPNQSLLFLLNKLSNELDEVKKVFQWFDVNLVVIYPETYPQGLPYLFETTDFFRAYTNEIISSFNLGISKIITEKIKIEEFYGEDNIIESSKIIDELENTTKKFVAKNINGEYVTFYKENNIVYALKLNIEHKNDKNNSVVFSILDESDGTRRLLDYLPLFLGILKYNFVYVVDEIERSIHPLLIKELIRKFSDDQFTNGQLIFTTHESNLLDQDILRQDEIWFAEKNLKGGTELYPLSDYKEHHTIDIRKGYLNGRYGAIPFLGNLKDLNWDKYVTETKKI